MRVGTATAGRSESGRQRGCRCSGGNCCGLSRGDVELLVNQAPGGRVGVILNRQILLEHGGPERSIGKILFCQIDFDIFCPATGDGVVFCRWGEAGTGSNELVDAARRSLQIVICGRNPDAIARCDRDTRRRRGCISHRPAEIQIKLTNRAACGVSCGDLYRFTNIHRCAARVSPERGCEILQSQIQNRDVLPLRCDFVIFGRQVDRTSCANVLVKLSRIALGCVIVVRQFDDVARDDGRRSVGRYEVMWSAKILVNISDGSASRVTGCHKNLLADGHQCRSVCA